MTKIVFRQKTDEELQADAAAKLKREDAVRVLEARPAPVEPPVAEAAVYSDEPPSFALDGEAEAPRAKKSRRK